MNGKNKAYLSCVLVMLLWGSLFPVIKLAYSAFSIDAGNYGSLLLFAGSRFTVCGAAILLFSACRGDPLRIPTKKDLTGVLLVGITAVLLHYTCTYIGLSMTDSSRTALIKQAGALVFICFPFLFFKEEKFSVAKVVSALLGLLGILALNTDFTNPGGGIAVTFGVGEALVLASSVCTVASNILVKKMTSGVPPIVMTGYSQLAGGVLLLAAGSLTGGTFGQAGGTSAAIFAYICAASIVSYCLWYTAVRRADLSRLLIIKFLEPLFAAVLGSVLLGEDVFNLSYLLAAAAILAAIVVSSGKREKRSGKA